MSSTEDITTARSLMKAEFRTIESGQPLREALEVLLDFREKTTPVPVVVVHTDGRYAGLFTPLAVFKSLLQKQRLDQLGNIPEKELLSAMDGQLDLPVAEAMIADAPHAGPDDRLLALLEMNSERRLEITPVLEDDRVIGILYVTDIFNAAASLAITHDTDVISLPAKWGEGGH